MSENHPIIQKEKSSSYYLSKYFKQAKNYQELIPSSFQSGKLYGMAKVHKINVWLRPVVSMVGTPEYQLAEYLDNLIETHSAVALQLRAPAPPPPPPKVSARAPAHRSYHFRGVKLKSCIKKIHHNLYISKQANVRIKHADTKGSSHKKFGTDARVQ